MGRTVRMAVLVAMLLAAVPLGASGAAGVGSVATAAAPAAPAAVADFNGDGIDDLVVGAPGEDLGGDVDAGVVDVVYGSESGLPGGGRQQLTQANPEDGDQFGAAVTTGDFNGDIFTDLAVAVPGENVGAITDAGAVEVFYGGGGGLPGVGDQLLRQGAAGLAGTAEAGDQFGAALSSGLVDDGDEADLAIGAPGEDVGAIADAGAVSLVDGAAGGLLGSPNLLITESTAETGDGFGSTVEVGDLSGGGGTAGPDDLAVGVPGENVGSVADAGAVVVPIGPSLHALLTQGGPATAGGSLPGATESGDQFGAALATGDFDGNNADNLVVGIPGEDVGTIADAGAVISLCGSEGLFEGCADGVLRQSHPETADLYGAALTSGNFDGNELTDLAVGAPGETVGRAVAAGAADARDGNIGGLEPFLTSPLFFQSNEGVPGSPETGDLFAVALAA